MQGGKHSAAAYSELEKWIYGSAKATIDSFVVSAGTGMSANISTGAGLIYDTIARRIATDATETATVPTASASFNRIDSVVAYIDTAVSPTTAVTDNTNDILKFVVVAGTAAATPVAPTGSAIVAAIGAGKPYLVLADILLPQNATNLSGATFTNRAPIIKNDSGWKPLTESWSYASWNGTTRIGVITVPSGATSRYIEGMRVRIEQPTGGTKYGIIVAVASTTLTVFFPSGTTFNNESVSYPAYSSQKAPLGFDNDPAIWSFTTSQTSFSATVAATGTYYRLAALDLVLPVGAWDLGFTVMAGQSNSTAGIQALRCGLSTATNSATDANLIAGHIVRTLSTSVSGLPHTRRKVIKNASQTTWYFVYNIEAGSGTIQFQLISGYGNHTITAICAYL